MLFKNTVFLGDGLQISKSNRKVFNFAFSIVNDENCNSAEGTYVLGLFELNKENYLQTLERLAPLFDQIKEISEIKHKNVTYKLKPFMFGDLKYLVCIYFNLL